MPSVVVRAPFGLPGLHRQQRGGAVEGLNLGLLVDAQHHGVLGRIDIQPDDVSDFVDQLRVRRQLEGLAAVGPQAESVPDATDGHATQPRRAGKRARAPMGGAGRGRSSAMTTCSTWSSDVDGARGPGSWLIQQPVDTVPCDVAYAPLAAVAGVAGGGPPSAGGAGEDHTCPPRNLRADVRERRASESRCFRSASVRTMATVGRRRSARTLTSSRRKTTGRHPTSYTFGDRTLVCCPGKT